MPSSRPSVIITASCAAGVLAGALVLAGGGAAGAKSDPQPNPRIATGRAAHATVDKPVAGSRASSTKYLQIDAMALAPDSNGDSFALSYSNGLSGTGGCYSTGFNPPTGTRLTGVRVYFTSNASSDLTVYLVRRSLTTGQSSILVLRSVADNSGTFKGATLPVSAAVDNTKYSFGFAACLGSGTTFKSARVSYQ